MSRPRTRTDPYRRVRMRRRFVLASWLLVAGALVARAAEVQLVEHADWTAGALAQHQKSKTIPAARGRILDRNGSELAVSHWRASVAVAPAEVRDRQAVQAALADHLGVRARTARIATDPARSWRVIPGRYSSTQVEGLRGLHGVHVLPELRRLYPREPLARGILGRVLDGHGSGGVEQAMDSALAGQEGRRIVARDNQGREIPARTVDLLPPAPGRDVVLTIDVDVQAVAEEILAATVADNQARGGDLIVTEPSTGEILAMTSIVEGSKAGLSAVNTTYEPGSTVKPFTSAALLHHGVATLTDSVDTRDGTWQVRGRLITDIGGGGWLTLHDVVRQSSNTGIAKFASRLTPAQQYTSFRDFGFGTRTGIRLPGEAAGVLRRPADWSLQSGHSLSFGYELAVTPLQMAMAFGALANGGALMEPRIVQQVRSADGREARFVRPRQVRRATPRWVTEQLTPVLVDVVESGTATSARMSSFLVAGKSGTARAVGPEGRYEEGAYYASFGAYFPADDPQLLFFVKLDRPTGGYYGGETAAPVTRAMLQTLLSARQVPLDRRALALAQRDRGPAPPATPLVRFASSGAGPAAAVPVGAGPVGSEGIVRRSRNAVMTVPALGGVQTRVALRQLHKMGLRVRLEGHGPVASTFPAAGGAVMPGDTVRVVARAK